MSRADFRSGRHALLSESFPPEKPKFLAPAKKRPAKPLRARLAQAMRRVAENFCSPMR